MKSAMLMQASLFGLLSQTASSASFAFTSGFPAFDAFDEFDDEKLSGFEVPSVEASSLKMELKEQVGPWSDKLDMKDICGAYSPLGTPLGEESCVEWPALDGSTQFYEQMIFFQPKRKTRNPLAKVKWGMYFIEGNGTCDDQGPLTYGTIEYGYIKPDFRKRGNVVKKSLIKRITLVPDVASRRELKQYCGCGYIEPEMQAFVTGKRCKAMNYGKGSVSKSHPDYCRYPETQDFIYGFEDEKIAIAANRTHFMSSYSWSIAYDKNMTRDEIDMLEVDLVAQRLPYGQQEGYCPQDLE